MQAQTQSQIDSMGSQQSWHRPTETGSCSNPLDNMYSALTAACKGRQEEGEEEDKEEEEEAYVS